MNSFCNSNCISVIIPVYNVEEYLDRCLLSIVKQTYCNIEVILVDDGSNDKSGTICDKWSNKYSNIKVIHQKNSGVSHARNVGLKSATGQFVGFVDPDDYIDKDMYEYLYHELQKKQADIVCCGFVHHYDDGSSHTQKMDDKIRNFEEAIEYDLVNGMFVTVNKLYIKDVLKNLFFDENIINGEDRLFDVSALMNANKVIYINKAFYHYCHRKNSAGTKEYTHRDFSLIDACKKINILVKQKCGRRAIQISESNLQKAYVHLLYMMKGVYKKNKQDKELCIDSLRKEIINIIINPYNSFTFKIKVLFICSGFTNRIFDRSHMKI